MLLSLKILNVITRRKPDHCSSSSPTPSAPTSHPCLFHLSLISNIRSSFVLQDTTSILSNRARQKHNAQSLALSFPKAHEKRKRAIYQTIHHPISISVKHLSLWFRVLSLHRTMIWKYLPQWHELGGDSLKLLPLSGMMQVKVCEHLRVCQCHLCVVKFLRVWQSYHCNHQTHTWLQFNHMASSKRSREKKESGERERERDNGGTANRVMLEREVSKGRWRPEGRKGKKNERLEIELRWRDKMK